MAAGLVAKMGYKNVMVCSDGIPGWKNAGYPLNTDKTCPPTEIPPLSATQVKEKLGEAYLLDVRYEQSYKQGFIKGSSKIPIYLLSKRVQEVPMGKPIIIIDSHGNPRYIPAGWFLKGKGYSEVFMLQGGFDAWVKEGYPIEK